MHLCISSLNEINKNLITTYGACGDVVRNIMACPVCDIDPEYSINLAKLAKEYTLGYIRHIEARNLGKRVWPNDQWELRDIVLKDLKAGKHDRKGR